jgi:hypothetical protein
MYCPNDWENMKRLLIVGAGLSGSSAKLIGEELGWQTTLIDESPKSSASRAALATIRPTWFDKKGRANAENSWKWYQKWDAAITRSAVVSSYKNPETKKMQEDWWLVDPWVMLQEPDYIQTVAKTEGTNLYLENEAKLNGEAILLAKGSKDYRFKPMFGATLISRNAEMLHPPLQVHHLRPYHSMMISISKGVTRLGSSISANEEKAIDEVYRMLAKAIELGFVKPDADWELVTGTRSKSENNQPVFPELGNPVGEINGLHRSGYALAPDAIFRWLESL